MSDFFLLNFFTDIAFFVNQTKFDQQEKIFLLDPLSRCSMTGKGTELDYCFFLSDYSSC